MSWPLLRKEFREHGVVLALVLLIGVVSLLGMLLNADRTAGRFTGFVLFVGVFGVLNAIILASRLIVREYAGRTQLFLEVLPVSRARVFATKWLLGGLLAVTAIAMAWLATFAWISRNEVIETSGALATLACASLFALCVWSFAALAGTLGRYRYVAWLTVIVVIAIVMQVGGVPLTGLPVMRLLGQDVAMALGRPTAFEFLQAGAVAAVCAIVAPLLALIGSGAMASALAQRMTVRERVFVITAFLGTFTLIEVLEPKPVKPPFKLTTEQQVQSEHARVGIMETVDLDTPAADRLAKTIAEDVESFVAALHWDVQPTVYILPQQGLDPTAMQRAYLGEQDGIVLRASPQAPRDVLRAFVIHEVLMDNSLARGQREDRHALLDGLAAYWVLRDDPEGRERWGMRAAAAGSVNVDTFLHWSLTSERLGECLSQGLAFVAFDVLVEAIGQDRALKLVRGMAAQPRDDIRVLFETKPEELLAAAGLTWAQLAQRIESKRAEIATRYANTLTERPTIEADVVWRDDADGGALHATVLGADEYRVFYRELLPWTADVVDMLRLDVRGGAAIVPVSPAKDSRWLVAVELDDAVLECPVRVFAKRVTIR